MILNILDIDLKCHFTLPKIGLPKIKTLTPPMVICVYVTTLPREVDFTLRSRGTHLYHPSSSSSLHSLAPFIRVHICRVGSPRAASAPSATQRPRPGRALYSGDILVPVRRTRTLHARVECNTMTCASSVHSEVTRRSNRWRGSCICDQLCAFGGRAVHLKCYSTEELRRAFLKRKRIFEAHCS